MNNKLAQIWQKRTMLQHFTYIYNADFAYSLPTVCQEQHVNKPQASFKWVIFIKMRQLHINIIGIKHNEKAEKWI